MFIENKYYKWYMAIIRKASINVSQGYTEKHHIIPRCMGGNNSSVNIVKLTAREHFISHVLLTECTTGIFKRKLIHAAWLLAKDPRKKGIRVNSRIYSKLREEHSKIVKEINTGKVLSLECKKNISLKAKERLKDKTKNPMYGKHHTEETRNCIRKSLLGKHPTEETRKKLRSLTRKHGEEHPNYGKTHSEETRKKMSSSQMGRVHSEETKEKISKTHEILTYEIMLPTGQIIFTNSLSRFSKDHNINISSIWKGKTKGYVLLSKERIHKD